MIWLFEWPDGQGMMKTEAGLCHVDIIPAVDINR